MVVAVTGNELLIGADAPFPALMLESEAVKVKVPPEPMVQPENVVTPNTSLPVQLDNTPDPEAIAMVTSE
jgi:hypothetical protein